MNQSQLYVFTGGPGSGKTSVLNALEKLGYHCAPEVGRAIIQSQVESGGNALPWRDKVAFRDAMFAQDKQLHQQYSKLGEIVFFDRSIVDTLGYSALEHLTVSTEFLATCRAYQYAKSVFLFPPWEAIFTNDRERKQDFKEAVATYEIMKKTYHSLGYHLIEVPLLPVEERVEFILSKLSFQCN
ncbi:AAA family ATPase [Vibrio rumoiensis]|uniref:ATP-binding protein n=1 Tax=Vibrio rumoiensis 1S-45 TaxID=1188252 RepID=A0A1E5E2I9_9VIBR|nr:AAA family ATPase [Vibrio rumoiensis]OEF25729.1 ATP-binding protein [Vibrio rumoiensis 1S-45]